MTTRENVNILVRKAKADLKKETDPERRKRIAIWGEEMNALALSLEKENTEEPTKVCCRCGHELPIKKFRQIVVHYTRKNGSKSTYYNRSKQCNKCMVAIRKENMIRLAFKK